MIKVLIASLPDQKQAGSDALSFIQTLLHKGFLLSDHLSDKNHLRSSIGYFMCQHLLQEHGVGADQLLTLRKGIYGKWELPFSSVDFNISHSGNKVVAAITDQGKVGVDIEEFRPIEWQDYKDNFTNEEWTWLSQSHHPEKTFYDLWTKKESLAKAYGFGLQLPLDQIIVNEQVGFAGDPNRKGYFYPLQIPGHSACVCTTEQQEMQVHPFSVF